MRFNRAKAGARCKNCPLAKQPKVWSEGPNIASGEWGGVVLCGESPGEDEARLLRPFVGQAGQQLDRMLGRASLLRQRVWTMNLIGCRPPRNDLDSDFGREALECCKPGLEAELEYLTEHGARVFVPLGSKPLSFFGVPGGVSRHRGYVYKKDERVVLPTYHPSYLMRGSFEEIPTSIADLRKARRIAFDGLEEVRPNFVLEPKLADLRRFAERVIKKKALLGVDIETTSLIPERGEIIVVGLAESGKSAFSVPLLRKGGRKYWQPAEEKIARRLLADVLASCPCVVQNALFDPAFLAHHGMPIARLEHDTILLHHALNPELPHRLSYIASIYASIPYWKDTLEDKESATLQIEDKELRTYNLWDALSLHLVLPEMERDAKALGVWEYYRARVMPLVAPVQEIVRTGMKLDVEAQEVWKSGLEEKIEELEARLRRENELPKALNLASGPHVRFLIYGEVPPQFELAQDELDAREESLRKIEEELKELSAKPEKSMKDLRRITQLRGQVARKRGSKVHQGLEAKAGLLGSVRRLVLPAGVKALKTKKGATSLDVDSFMSLQNKVHARVLEIERMKRPPKGVAEEKRELERTQAFLSGLLELRAAQKLLGTYGEFETWSDGRVHFPMKMHGTATGRLASGDKKNLGVGNGQNIPKEARKLFIAEEGCVLIGGDYSSLEPRVLAYISGDDVAIKDFASGIKIYHAVMRDMGIGKDHPQFDLLYKAFKTFVLCTNYGGSVETAYAQMCIKVPNIPITLAELKRMNEMRMASRPAYAAWKAETEREVLKTRVLTNFGGRRRIFLGPAKDIVREALDYGPQSGAAEVMNRATVLVHSKLRKLGMRTKLVLQIHDALYLEAPEEEKVRAARILKEGMETPVDVGKYKGVVFPAELEWGTCWGELEPIPEEVLSLRRKKT